MSSSLIEIKYSNNSKVLNTLKKKNITDFKGIVLDSIENLGFESIEKYMEKQYQDNKMTTRKGKIYNYFVDKDSRIYKLIPDEYSGNVCKYDRYSSKASVAFPIYCPPTDAKYSPRDYSPDEVVDSILVEMPSNNLTPSQDYALRDLISYIFGKYNFEKKEIIVNTDNIYLRRMFPMDETYKNKCGFIFENLISFMIFKKKIRQSLIGNSTTNAYKMCIEKINEIIFEEKISMKLFTY